MPCLCGSTLSTGLPPPPAHGYCSQYLTGPADKLHIITDTQAQEKQSCLLPSECSPK